MLPESIYKAGGRCNPFVEVGPPCLAQPYFRDSLQKIS